jgi:adenylate cyclase
MRRLKIWWRRFARKFGFARLVCLGLLVVFAGLRVWDPPPVQELRLRTFDMFQLIDPRDKKGVRPVTIIDIDDKSLAKFGQWPWPRTRIADMIINLTNLGAVAIGFGVGDSLVHNYPFTIIGSPATTRTTRSARAAIR